MNRQRLILFILVIFFGIAALWSYSAMPRLKTVGTLPGKPPQQAKTAVTVPGKKVLAKKDDGTRLNIALLDNESPEFKGYRRNIFKPVFIDELKIVKQKPAAIIAPKPIVVVPQVIPVSNQPKTEPLARFTFLGFFKKGSVRTIFLEKDKEILLVKKGDKIAGRYEASEISDQALTLIVTDTGDEIVIPLMENRPLTTLK
jgi:hypothetical protein